MPRLEASIEKALAELRYPDGLAPKLEPSGRVGIPDRLLILPHRLVFVEVKRPHGGRVSPAQEVWRQRLLHWGHEHAFVKTLEEVHELVRQR